MKVIKHKDKWYLQSDTGYKEILLSTDDQLIKDGVQAIDDEFLEWFVKNPSCEEVDIIYGLFNPMGMKVDQNNLGQNHSKCVWKYKIIIPKQEFPQFGTKEFVNMCENIFSGKPKQEIHLEDIFNDEKKEGIKKLIQKQKLIDMMEQDEQLGLYQETFEEIVSKQFQGDFNKEVGKVLTQELQKRNNMTAVEWLYKNLLENPISNQDVEYNEAVFHNAKEMEKQQIIDGAKWQQEQISKSEFLQKLRATMSDAEARRLILETFKNK